MSKKKSSGDIPSLKGVSLTPALTALLKPSADLLGKELRDTLKEAIDGWKAKRRNENLHVHETQGQAFTLHPRPEKDGSI